VVSERRVVAAGERRKRARVQRAQPVGGERRQRGLADIGSQPPTATRPGARRISSRTTDVLPMPASPSSSTIVPAPSRAAFQCPSSTASGCCRSSKLTRIIRAQGSGTRGSSSGP